MRPPIASNTDAPPTTRQVHVWRMDQWLDEPCDDVAKSPVVMNEYDSEVRAKWVRKRKGLCWGKQPHRQIGLLPDADRFLSPRLALTPTPMHNRICMQVQHLAWDPQGRLLATSDSGTATVWCACASGWPGQGRKGGGGGCLCAVPGTPQRTLCSADVLAHVTPRRRDFGDTTDRPAHSIICGGHEQGSQITCFCFSPDGSYLVRAFASVPCAQRAGGVGGSS